MKKLMIAAAIAMMAVASQAASFVWAADGNKGKDWEDAYIGMSGNVNAFLYLGEITFDTTTKCTLDFSKASEMYLASSSQDPDSFNYGSNGAKISSDNLKSDAAHQPYTIILAEVNDLGEIPALSDGLHFALIKGETSQATDPMPPYGTWATMVDDTILEKGNWYTYDSTPVPEPTSAMLLLLGVAGLALRRKTK